MRWRHRLALAVVAVAGGVLAARAVELEVFERDFLVREGEARHLRTVTVAAHRGMILDRNGEPLAVSTPVPSVWAEPAALLADEAAMVRVARTLGLDARRLRRELDARRGREFHYLRRHVTPETAERVLALGAPGVGIRREYRRYYPAGEVAAHVVGVTDVDDVGQEGIELAYDGWLRGRPGAKRVVRDRLGRPVADVELVRPPQPGRDLHLTLDRRIQYLAYRELKAAVQAERAAAGAAVVLDARSGEVLALAVQPSYNPNNRAAWDPARRRNRALTDPIEPGSTIKPFTLAAALESGRFRATSVIDTSPGRLRVGDLTVHDLRDYGAIDLATVLIQSSNVGAAAVALALPAERLWAVFDRVGFGRPTGSGFPGEAAGTLRDWRTWREVEQATLGYGYGLAVTPLQLARAYAAIAAGGMLPPVRLVQEAEAPPPARALPYRVALELRSMLEGVVARGTGRRAAVPGYRVAGKTGTVRKVGPGGYLEDRYRALFVGMAPASRPRLVVAVMIDDPRGESYYGGEVAAPVFARIMAGALRLLDVPPDALPAGTQVAALGRSEP
ncbi:peptidoglycan D,D-transpeptidase FtsI family protein [Inmirania thermothiophila]|nr:penicillin-binding protein 2 [Inmirania thermothiophila]